MVRIAINKRTEEWDEKINLKTLSTWSLNRIKDLISTLATQKKLPTEFQNSAIYLQVNENFICFVNENYDLMTLKDGVLTMVYMLPESGKVGTYEELLTIYEGLNGIDKDYFNEVISPNNAEIYTDDNKVLYREGVRVFDGVFFPNKEGVVLSVDVNNKLMCVRFGEEDAIYRAGGFRRNNNGVATLSKTPYTFNLQK